MQNRRIIKGPMIYLIAPLAYMDILNNTTHIILKQNNVYAFIMDDIEQKFTEHVSTQDCILYTQSIFSIDH